MASNCSWRVGVIASTQFAAVVAILLWPAGGWAKNKEVSVGFNPSIERKVDARPAPAKVATEDASTLKSKGYVEMGTITASLPREEQEEEEEKASPEVTQQLEAAVLKKAAEVGGDVVRFDKEGVFETKDVTVKTKHEGACERYEARSVYAGQQGCVQKCVTDFDETTCTKTGCSPKYETRWECVRWAKEVPITETETGIVSEGTVWRYDPKLAAELIHGREIDNLFKALDSGDWTTIKAALNDDPGLVASRDKDSKTPLHYAARSGSREMADLLMAKGADVSARASDGATPLHEAALNGHKDVVELLLAKGADVNARANDGATPLWWALKNSHGAVVELLRQHGGRE